MSRLFNAGEEQLERRANVGRWQIVRAEFPTANEDVILRHTLITPDPEQIAYQQLNSTSPAALYHDGSATRAAWGHGFVRLRVSIAPCKMDILLTVVAAPYGTTKLPAGEAVIPGINADTLDGLDSSSFTQNAFKTIVVSGETDVVADSPTDTLEFEAGAGIDISTNPGSDKVTIASTVTAISALDDIPDVVITAPSDGEVLTYDSGDWVNAAPTGGGGSVSPIAPDAISGLQMWLEADAIVGLVNNDPVVTWEDSHTSNNDMTQATGANQPLYKTNIVNGLPTVRFDDSNDGMTSVTSLSLSAPFSIFYVANYGNTGGNQRLIGSTSQNWLMGPYGGAWNYYAGGGFANNVGAAGSDFVIHGLVQQSSTATHFLVQLNSSALIYPATIGSVTQATIVPSVAPAIITLGASNVFGEPFGGDLAECIVYNTAISSADGAGLVQYLIDKYGT